MATVISALALTACGGDATVENDDVSSVDPLTRSSESGGETTADTSAETAEPEETGEPAATPGQSAPPAEPQPEDGAAEEIEEIPEQTAERSPEEQALLSEVGEGGIDTAGVEDQIIGAAATVCDTEGQNVIVPAAAGQLVEQGKTELSPEEAASLIESAANSAYC